MADSKFDICNKAMVLVGANTITSFTENTTESKVAGQLYESTLENLITRVECASAKIIDGNFTDMGLSLSKSIEKAIIGISNLKITYDNDSEIVARLTICTNKIMKVFENLKEYNDTLNDVASIYNDINTNENSNRTV